MNRHLSWNELDAWIHGRLEGPEEVHLAECGDCAEKLKRFRAEERGLREALAPDEIGEDEIDGLVDRLERVPRRASWSGIVPLLAASLMVGSLMLVLTSRTPRPADPIALAIAANDRAALDRFGWKAAPHVPAAAAEPLRRRPIRVLYAEGESRNEYRMLRPALLKDPGLLVHTMLLNSRDEDLYGKSETAEGAAPRFRDIARIFPLADDDLIDYDVILIGEVDANRLASSPDVLEAALRSFVTRLGGKVILIAGPKMSESDAHHALSDLLPVELARGSAVTTRGPGAPSLRWHFDVPLRPAAVRLAGDDAALTSSIAAGRGRVVFVASDDFWSWGPERQYAFYRDLIGN